LLQQLAAYGASGHSLSHDGLGGTPSPRRGTNLNNSPSGGLASKFSKYSIQERMRKYKTDYATK